MSGNIQTNTTGQLTPCLQKKIDKTTYLVEVHFSSISTQSVEEVSVMFFSQLAKIILISIGVIK